MTRSEKRWVWIFAIVVIILTTIPYAIGFALQGDAWRYTGFIFGVEDGNSYIAKMLSGSAGEWLFRTPYTAYPQNGVMAFLPYILLGKLAAQPGLHDQLVALFHLFRWAAILVYALAAYDFISIFLSEVRHRRTALILIFLGGGLGFLSVFGIKGSGWYGGLPLEFYSPESFGFLAVFGLPHIVAGRAFLLWALAIIIKNTPARSFWYKALIAGGMLNLLGFMQPLTVVVAWVILAGGLAAEWLIFWLRRHKQADIGTEDLRSKTRLALAAGLLSAPIPVYTFLSFQLDPFLANWNQQNLILSPPPGDYLLAYGLFLPFVIAGVIFAIRKGLFNGVFLAGWFVLFPFLAYVPYPLQRRLPEAIWVCIVLLAMLAVVQETKNSLWKRLQPLLFLGLFSTLLFYAGSIRTVQSVQRPLYVPRAEVSAFDYFNQNEVGSFPVVLADYDISNAVPAWAPVRTVIGHGPESVNLATLRPQVDAWLDGSLSAADAIDLLKAQQVSFVLTGPANFREVPAQYPLSGPIFSSDKYSIYKVEVSQ